MGWKQTLATVAPGIATALGGPLAGMAVKLATDALGIEPNEEALIQAVSTGNPEVFAQLRVADNNLKVELKKLDIDLERIHSEDRGSARDLAKSTSIAPQTVLATVFVLAFSGVLFFIFAGDTVQPAMKDAMMYLLGILSAGMIQIMNFFFGSSSGSKSKTALMGKK